MRLLKLFDPMIGFTEKNKSDDDCALKLLTAIAIPGLDEYEPCNW